MLHVGEIIHQMVRLVGIPEFRELQQLCAAGEDALRPAGLGEDLQREARDGRHKPHGVAHGALRGGDEHRGDLILRDAGEAGVEHCRKLLDHRLLHGKGQVHQLVPDLVAAQERHDDEGVGVHVDYVEAADGVRRERRHGDGGVVGHVRGDASHVLHHLVQLLDLDVQAAVDLLGLLDGELAALHQLVDIEPVALRRGDATRAGVGLFQVAEAGELCQLVADGGGGNVQPCLFGDQLAAHRLGVGDVLIHHRREDLLFSLADLHSRSPLRSIG